MARNVTIKGEREVLRNLNREIGKIRGRTVGGMTAVGKFVQGESMETTPVDFGVLINSAFSGVGVFGKVIFARIGYTAKYAPFVHEMPDTNNFSKPGTGPKFLQRAVVNNIGIILKIIQNRAKVRR